MDNVRPDVFNLARVDLPRGDERQPDLVQDCLSLDCPIS